MFNNHRIVRTPPMVGASSNMLKLNFFSAGRWRRELKCVWTSTALPPPYLFGLAVVVPCNGIQHWIAFTCKKIIADGPNRNSNQFLGMDFPKYANRNY
jgi:hypothetical protein